MPTPRLRIVRPQRIAYGFRWLETYEFDSTVLDLVEPAPGEAGSPWQCHLCGERNPAGTRRWWTFACGAYGTIRALELCPTHLPTPRRRSRTGP